MTTNAAHYYQRTIPAASIDCAVREHDKCVQKLSCTCTCHDHQMTYREPSLLERNGESIVAILGAVVFGFALGIVTFGLVLA